MTVPALQTKVSIHGKQRANIILVLLRANGDEDLQCLGADDSTSSTQKTGFRF